MAQDKAQVLAQRKNKKGPAQLLFFFFYLSSAPFLPHSRHTHKHTAHTAPPPSSSLSLASAATRTRHGHGRRLPQLPHPSVLSHLSTLHTPPTHTQTHTHTEQRHPHRTTAAAAFSFPSANSSSHRLPPPRLLTKIASLSALSLPVARTNTYRRRRHRRLHRLHGNQQHSHRGLCRQLHPPFISLSLPTTAAAYRCHRLPFLSSPVHTMVDNPKLPTAFSPSIQRLRTATAKPPSPSTSPLGSQAQHQHQNTIPHSQNAQTHTTVNNNFIFLFHLMLTQINKNLV